MPNYPAQIDTTLSLPTAIDNLTPVQGAIFNRLRDAVIAIESELGIKPSSIYSTVKNRLDTIENTITTTISLNLTGDVIGNINSTIQVINIQGNPVSDVAPQFGEVLTWNGIAWAPTAQSLPYMIMDKGTGTLSSGTASITTSYTFVGSEKILLTLNTLSGTIGYLECPSADRSGTSFVVNSNQANGSIQTLDNSTFDWIIIK